MLSTIVGVANPTTDIQIGQRVHSSSSRRSPNPSLPPGQTEHPTRPAREALIMANRPQPSFSPSPTPRALAISPVSCDASLGRLRRRASCATRPMPTATSSSTRAPTRLSAVTASSAGMSPPGSAPSTPSRRRPWTQPPRLTSSRSYAAPEPHARSLPGARRVRRGLHRPRRGLPDAQHDRRRRQSHHRHPNRPARPGRPPAAQFEPQESEGAYPIPVFRPV